MATHDYILDNDNGANFRADINNALSAIVSQNSSDIAPTTTYPYMVWADTTADIMKVRNSADTEWISVYTLSTGVPISGVGGGGTTPQPGTYVGLDYSIAPLTVQPAATPISSSGVAYSSGDLFVRYEPKSSYSSNIVMYVALKDFTFGDFGAAYHELKEDCWAFEQSSMFTADSSTALLTGVTIDVQGIYVSFSDFIFDTAGYDNIIGAPIAIAVPVNPNISDALFAYMPMVNELAKTNNIVIYVDDEDGPFQPSYIGTVGNNYNIPSKDFNVDGFSITKGITLGYSASNVLARSGAGGAWAGNGAVIPVGSLDAHSADTFLDGDSVFIENNHSKFNPIGTNFLRKTQVDSNTIRIGTYNTANGGTLTVGIA